MEKNVSRFTKQELKLLRKMENGNSDIQYYSGYDGEFLIHYGDKPLTTRTVIIFHKREGKEICIGHLGGKSFNSDPLFNDAFSVFIDRRLKESVFLDIKIGDYNVDYSTQDLSAMTDEVLLIFMENRSNAHLIILDRDLDKKFGEFLAIREDSRELLKFFTMSYVSHCCPNLFQ